MHESPTSGAFLPAGDADNQNLIGTLLVEAVEVYSIGPLTSHQVLGRSSISRVSNRNFFTDSVRLAHHSR